MGPFKGDVKLNVLKEKLSEINPVDIADIIEELDPEHRMAVFSQLNTEKASDTLEEIEPRVTTRTCCVFVGEPHGGTRQRYEHGASGRHPRRPSATDTDAILEKIDPEEREKIRLLLDKHDDHILGFCYIALHHVVARGRCQRCYRRLSRDGAGCRWW